VPECLASRRLRLRGGAGPHVEVRIWAPEREQSGATFRCEYQIVGLGNDKIRYTIGIDAVHALQMVLQKIGTELYTSREFADGRLSWVGGSVPGDLGFPVPRNIADIPPAGTG